MPSKRLNIRPFVGPPISARESQTGRFYQIGNSSMYEGVIVTRIYGAKLVAIWTPKNRGGIFRATWGVDCGLDLIPISPDEQFLITSEVGADQKELKMINLHIGQLGTIQDAPGYSSYAGTVVTKVFGDKIVSLAGYDPFNAVWDYNPANSLIANPFSRKDNIIVRSRPHNRVM